jgi:aspartyl aminopeptidase
MNYANLTKTSYIKKEGTKTVWIETGKTTEEISENHYNNFINAAPSFRRMGGSETLQRTYTKNGYKVVKLISTSPDKMTKHVYTFDHDMR